MSTYYCVSVVLLPVLNKCYLLFYIDESSHCQPSENVLQVYNAFLARIQHLSFSNQVHLFHLIKATMLINEPSTKPSWWTLLYRTKSTKSCSNQMKKKEEEKKPAEMFLFSNKTKLYHLMECSRVTIAHICISITSVHSDFNRNRLMENFNKKEEWIENKNRKRLNWCSHWIQMQAKNIYTDIFRSKFNN